jgi:thiol-disulfide isomerase/thioredoxin
MFPTDVAGQAVYLAALLTVATLTWWILRLRSGTFREPGHNRSEELLDTVGTLGRRATLVQFSTTFCSTCPQVRQVLTRVAEDRPGVRHVELDVEEHPHLARSLGVLRTPTVLVLDPDGALRARSSGPMRPEQVTAVLDTEHDRSRSAQ